MTWHEAQRARLAEGEQRLAAFPRRAQGLLRAELRIAASMVDIIEPETAERGSGAVQSIGELVDDLVAEIVVMADALEEVR